MTETMGEMSRGKRVKSLSFLAAVSLMYIIATLSGCAPLLIIASVHDSDVSGKGKLWGGFAPGEAYVTTTDTFLGDDHDWGTAPYLTPPKNVRPKGRGGEWCAPDSVGAYVKNPLEWPEIVGVVEKGTSLRVMELRKHDTLFQKGWLYVVARIEDGEFEGQEVNICDLSMDVPETDHPQPVQPDLSFLTLAEKPDE